MVKPPDGFFKYRIQEWWKGSQAGTPKWWSCQWRVCGRRGLVVPPLLWTVSWRNSTPVDAVHPQSGKFQTDRATVQGHMVHSEWCILRRLFPVRPTTPAVVKTVHTRPACAQVSTVG